MPFHQVILRTYPSWETGGRLKEIAGKWSDRISRLIDLHVYPNNNSACLGAPHELQDRCPKGTPLHQFIDDLVVPYFYALSHFEKYGRWPWGERSHGMLGLLESYAERRIQSTREDVVQDLRQLRICINWKELGKYLTKFKERRLGLCGKERLVAECHPLAWQGLLKLQRDARAFKLNVHHC
ncbi:MAG: hypothetical protein IPN62_05165 [Flavobacteriales bacterium]|nr:hypothetical protein [Flavobacteriales bacterium]